MSGVRGPDCQVCTETFTKQLRRKVTCPFCDYECCSSCAQRYILGSPAANCMNCHRAWTRKMLIDMFTRVFVDRDYRRARSDVLFELEKSMFPETMPNVELEMLKRRNMRKIWDNNRTRDAIYQRVGYFRGLSEQIPDMLEIRRLELVNEVLQREIENVKIKKEPAREFVQPCSRNGCNGFLSTAWKCRVCDRYTCKDCHEPVEDLHECNPDTVKSVQQIKSDSKPCPKCASVIFKVSGCDQMYCTSCHTAFSWRTGKIELGRIHNPHYYEYQRQRGQLNREIGDIQCGGLPDAYALNWTPNDVRQFHRHLLEFQQYQLPQYVVGEVTAFDLNLRARVNFLTNDMNEDSFKDELYRKDKDIAKKREIGMVGTTCLQIMSDIYNKLVGTHDLDIFRAEILGSAGYCNELFADISRVYNCVVPWIDYPVVSYKNVKTNKSK